MLSQSLIDSVKRHEGFRVSAYQDSEGYWTIGYGSRLIEDNIPEKWRPHITITKEFAEELLREDLLAARADALAVPIVGSLNAARQDVLIEMCFNLGITKLLRFKRMWAAIDRADWEAVRAEMLDSKWADQVGRRADRLAARMFRG